MPHNANYPRPRINWIDWPGILLHIYKNGTVAGEPDIAGDFMVEGMHSIFFPAPGQYKEESGARATMASKLR